MNFSCFFFKDFSPSFIKMFYFYKIGFVSTYWSNVTVRQAKPLLVTSPIIIPLDPTTVRFEWIKPLTYCEIVKFILTFVIAESVPSSSERKFSVEVKPSNGGSERANTVVVNSFRPFTVYSVTLSACVSSPLDSLCTSSFERTFQTPGTLPQGLTVPRVRQVLAKAVSIEWQEPLFRNGLRLNYQLVRYQLELNKTETIYSGLSLFFLDTGLLSI